MFLILVKFDNCELAFVFLISEESFTVSLVALWLMWWALDMLGFPKGRWLTYPGDVGSKSPDTLK